jgi:hypothetical protein
MGQYRQWLHYREVDQRLHAQLETLEQELTQLHEQARLLQELDYHTDNTIIQALSTYQKNGESLKNSTAAPDVHDSIDEQSGILVEDFIIEDVSSSTTAVEFIPETVSPALFGWSRLPNFDTQRMREPVIVASTLTSLPPTPPPEINLLPEDMAAFMDAHSQTSSQRSLPWWIPDTSSSSPTDGPVDQQSLRTDQRVQRWLERWRRVDKDAQMAQED